MANGNGSLVSQAANSAYLQVVSRLSMIVVPFLVWFLFQEVWNGQKLMARELGDVRRDVAVQGGKIDFVERRIDELGFRVDKNEMRR